MPVNDPIYEVTDLIKAIWYCFPGMRYFQLIAFLESGIFQRMIINDLIKDGHALFPDVHIKKPDLFNLEDEVLIPILKSILRDIQQA